MDKEENSKMDLKAESPKDSDVFLKPTFIKPFKKKALVVNESLGNKEKESENNNTKSSDPISSSTAGKEKCPSQIVTENKIPIPYKEPPWSGLLPSLYSLEIIKNGVMIENIPISKPYIVFGRLANCDVILEHPTVSRFHCILQCRVEASDTEPVGVYVYDLGSTHGTFQNKYRLQPKKYNRMRVGHMLKFGGSTRIFILHGPSEDEEPESQHTVSELIAMSNERKQKLKMDEENRDKKEERKTDDKAKEEDEGIDWGMGEDAQEENESDENDEQYDEHFSSLNDELVLDDPKKTLRGWFERRGFDPPEYIVEDVKPGLFAAKVVIPISDCGKRTITSSIEHRGKKKDAVFQCALDACRTLDRRGILRLATNDSLEEKAKTWRKGQDSDDSDDDEFLDRTGDVERKRENRKCSTTSGLVVDYESLKKQYDEIISNLELLDKKLRLTHNLTGSTGNCPDNFKGSTGNSSVTEVDELDSFMTQLSSQVPERHKRVTWKIEQVKLKKEEARIRKLLNVARPRGVSEYKEWTSGVLSLSADDSIPKKFISKRKTVAKVHEIFGAEEVAESKPKIRKINLDEEDESEIAPIPYCAKSKSISTRYTRPPVTPPIHDPARLISPPKVDQGIFKVPRLDGDRECATTVLPTNQLVTREGNISTLDENPSKEAKPRLVDDQPTCVALHDIKNKTSNQQLSTVSESVEMVSSTTEESADSDPDSFKLPMDSAIHLKSKTKNSAIPISGNLSAHKSSSEASKSKHRSKKTHKNDNPVDFDPDYENWVPPMGQTGDGRTSLNDKYGY